MWTAETLRRREEKGMRVEKEELKAVSVTLTIPYPE
jgi:hypothetical protein